MKVKKYFLSRAKHYIWDDSYQNWSGAHGPKPCRNWAPKSPKSVLHTSWLNEPVEPVEKIFEILKECSLKNKESIKKIVHIPRSDEEDMIKTSPSAPNSELLQWILPKLKFLGSLTSFPIAWCERLGKLAMTELQNELHTRTTLDHKWTYTRLRNQSRPKGGHDGVIWKHGCMWHP